MKKIFCDCCGKEFKYDRKTQATKDAKHALVLSGHGGTEVHRVTVEINIVTAFGADLCANCRNDAVVAALNNVMNTPDLKPEL